MDRRADSGRRAALRRPVCIDRGRRVWGSPAVLSLSLPLTRPGSLRSSADGRSAPGRAEVGRVGMKSAAAAAVGIPRCPGRRRGRSPLTGQRRGESGEAVERRRGDRHRAAPVLAPAGRACGGRPALPRPPLSGCTAARPSRQTRSASREPLWASALLAGWRAHHWEVRAAPAAPPCPSFRWHAP